MFTLFTDTDTDITPELAEEYGYHIISMPYCIDGKTIYPLEDGAKYDPHDFYEKLRQGAVPTTASINAERYINYFEPILAAGQDILYVHFSSKMSMTFDVMRPVVAELLKKYPGRRFETVDTKGISVMCLAIVLEIGDMVKAGKSMDEILAWADKEVDHFALYLTVDNLTYLHHSGRVSGLAATVGTIVGIRPIIQMNNEGQMVNVDKAIGKIKALNYLADQIGKLGDNIRDHYIFIGHADSDANAEKLKQIILERYGADLKIGIVPVNPTIGSHSGPDGIGLAFHAVHR